MSKSLEDKRIDIGEKRYFNFVKQVLGEKYKEKTVRTPTTDTLEIFGTMEEGDEYLLGFMIEELLGSFDLDTFRMRIEDDVLYRIYNKEEKQEYYEN